MLGVVVATTRPDSIPALVELGVRRAGRVVGEGGRDRKLIIPQIFHPVALWLWQREEHWMLGMFDRTSDPLTLPQLALPSCALGGNGLPCRLHPRRRLQGGETESV